jgi:hypothetical protein
MKATSATRFGLGLLLSWVLANTLSFAIGEIAFTFLSPWPLITLTFYLGPTIGYGVGSLLISVPIGIAQWLVLRKCLDKANWWIFANVLGWLVASVALLMMRLTTQLGLQGFGLQGIALGGDAVGWLVVGIAFGLVASILQQFTFPSQGHRAGQWLLFNPTGWAIGITLGWLVGHDSAVGVFGAMSGLFGGLFTGLALAFMLHNAAQETAKNADHTTALSE